MGEGISEVARLNVQTGFEQLPLSKLEWDIEGRLHVLSTVAFIIRLSWIVPAQIGHKYIGNATESI